LKQDSLILTAAAGATLDVLVENNGRINYGPFLIDNRQGLTGKVTLSGTELTGWKMYSFPFNTTTGLKYLTSKKVLTDLPVVSSGSFTVSNTADTYLDMHGFGKGFVFLNGHNLGKYWHIGPQQTIYVPAVWLKKGVNHIEVFDELTGDHQSISTLDHAVLNSLSEPGLSGLKD
jgi:beta-galactosidase